MNYAIDDNRQSLSASSYFGKVRSSAPRTPAPKPKGQPQPAEPETVDASELLDAVVGWQRPQDIAFHALVQRLRALQIETAKEGWDDEGGRAIPYEQWIEAVLVLAEVLGTPAMPCPHVGASGDGYVHLTWFDRAGNRLVIELGPSTGFLTRLGIDGTDRTTELAGGEGAGQAILAEQFAAV